MTSHVKQLISFNYLSTGKNTPRAFVAKNPHAPDAKRSIEIVNLIAAQFTQQFLRTRIRSEQTIRHPCCCHEHADVETHRWSRPGLGRCGRCNCQMLRNWNSAMGRSILSSLIYKPSVLEEKQIGRRLECIS